MLLQKLTKLMINEPNEGNTWVFGAGTGELPNFISSLLFLSSIDRRPNTFYHSKKINYVTIMKVFRRQLLEVKWAEYLFMKMCFPHKYQFCLLFSIRAFWLQPFLLCSSCFSWYPLDLLFRSPTIRCIINSLWAKCFPFDATFDREFPALVFLTWNFRQTNNCIMSQHSVFAAEDISLDMDINMCDLVF